MQTHIVKAGECLSLIAAKYTFQDYKTIYDHPDNKELKKKRPNPNIIHPDDVIVIPDKKEKVAFGATDKLHQFKLKRPHKHIHVQIRDHLGEAFAFEKYVLTIGTTKKVIEGYTDGDGVVKEEIPVNATSAELTVGNLHWTLKIGDLNPINDTIDDGISGIQQRLKNLGIDPGRIDGIIGPKTMMAICLFEGINGIKITGECTEATLVKLKEVHGC